ncbi:MAG: hemolysin III family protein [Actinomycetota bacterium]|nr:hemolysin III family protein [Actinomycetota bacterium]
MTPRTPSSSPEPPDGRARAGEPDADNPVSAAVERVADALDIKPSWRGWIHLGAAPAAFVAGIALVLVAPTALAKSTSAVYAITGVLMFGTSALYHRGNWTPRMKGLLKRLDHTNIMLVIAGTYTPLSALLLSRSTAALVLWVIWIGAVLGVLFRILWVHAPRWLYVPIYVALGMAALVFLPEFFSASPAATVLICIGGAFYIAGAVIYGIRKPNFSVNHFGFHELFHAFTVVGFALHFIAVLIAVFR